MTKLAANAATDFGKSTPANGTRNSLLYSGPPTSIAVDHATLSYTNNMDEPVEVEVFGSLTWWIPNTSNTWRAGPVFRGTNDGASIDDSGQIGSSDVTVPAQYAFSKSFTVQPTKTLTMKISSFFSTASGSGNTGTTFQWADMVLKYNALKR